MTIFKLGNIKLRINYLLIGLLILYYYLGYGLEVVIGLSSVLVHEISHSITAISLGVKVKEIELFPFGGVARLSDNLGGEPKKEILVSIMGPISNIIIAVLFFIIKNLYIDYYIFDIIIRSNIIIGGFNILPIFPLDGGRIVRGYLSKTIGYKSSTRFLTLITYVLSLLSISYGVIQLIVNKGGIYFIILALFISLAAKKENDMAAFVFMGEITKKKSKLLNSRIMGSHILVALKNTTAKEILDCFLPNKYHIIVVIDRDGKGMGHIKENDLLDGIIKYGIDITLENLLNSDKKC